MCAHQSIGHVAEDTVRTNLESGGAEHTGGVVDINVGLESECILQVLATLLTQNVVALHVTLRRKRYRHVMSAHKQETPRDKWNAMQNQYGSQVRKNYSPPYTYIEFVLHAEDTTAVWACE